MRSSFKEISRAKHQRQQAQPGGCAPSRIYRKSLSLYHQLRTNDPVRWDEGTRCWALTRYADVIVALRDPRFSAERFRMDTSWIPEELFDTLEPPIRALTRQMLFRDPPDHTRLRRQENRHMSFGQGIHFCLGAALARAEAEIAFTTLLRRLPEPRVGKEDVVWEPSMVFRGLSAFPLVFG